MELSKMQKATQPAVGMLLESDEDQLYEELAIRMRAVEMNPVIAGQFDLSVSRDAQYMGLPDDLRSFGKHFFERFSPSAYSLVCGDSAADVGDRQKITDAFGIGETAVAAAIAGVLVTSLGLAPAIAAVLAAIVIKLFFRNVYGAMCDVWKEKLPE